MIVEVPSVSSVSNLVEAVTCARLFPLVTYDPSWPKTMAVTFSKSLANIAIIVTVSGIRMMRDDMRE